jgi:hypothetical protein
MARVRSAEDAVGSSLAGAPEAMMPSNKRMKLTQRRHTGGRRAARAILIDSRCAAYSQC